MSFREQQNFCIANVSSKVRINYYSTLQIESSGLYLKEVFGDNVEFSDDTGTFDLNLYLDQTKFEVLSNSILSNFRQASTPEICQNVTTSQAACGRRFASPLATIKVVKADLEITGRPSSLHKYNMSVHINIYNKSEACVSHIDES